MIKISKICLVLFLLLFSLSLLLNIILIYQTIQRNLVVAVVDGDSFQTKDNRRVRLLGIDTPEKNRCFYEQAKQRPTSLILGKQVKLMDIVTDDYGRIMANVFVGKTLVNQVMIEEGLAKFTYVSSPYYDKLKQAYLLAKNQKTWNPLPCL